MSVDAAPNGSCAGFRECRHRWRRVIAIGLICCGLGTRPAVGLTCVGDCQREGKVSITDLIVGVNIVLGSEPVTECVAFANLDGAVDIAQLIQGVNNALNGCSGSPSTPSPTPTATATMTPTISVGRFADNGDGTITDRQTGLMWEKKVGLGAGVDVQNLHAADNTYPWAGECALERNPCQPTKAAAAACKQWTQNDQTACATCQSDDIGLDNSCVVEPDGETTVWDWVVQLNAASFAGYADWRMPTIAELESIADYMTINPAVDRAFNGMDCGATCTDVTSAACSCTQFQAYGNQCGPYWSATTSALIPEEGWWFIAFCGGYDGVGPNSISFTIAYVRAVRGGSAPPMPRFLDNGEGTITDKQTGLIWEKKVAVGAGVDPGNLHAGDNTYTWAGKCSVATDILCQPNDAAAAACAQSTQGDQTACATCPSGSGTCVIDPLGTGALTTMWDWLAQLNTVNFAGHADWRVPTEPELESIVDYTAADPALSTAFSEPTCTEAVGSCDVDWSATPGVACPGIAWVVAFGEGELYSGEMIYAFRLRAVRGGS